MSDPYKANWLCYQALINTNKTHTIMYDSYNTSLPLVDAFASKFSKEKVCKGMSAFNFCLKTAVLSKFSFYIFNISQGFLEWQNLFLLFINLKAR